MKVGFIYNPNSGSGKIKNYISWIEKQFIEAGKTVILLPTEKPLDAARLAHENRDLEMLLVAGGDGTLSEVVNGLMKEEKRPYIGYIPTGTANDFGSMIGFGKRIKRTVRTILKEEMIKAVDITQINDYYFTYACATGKFTEASYDINQSDKRKYRKLAYIARGSKDVFKRHKISAKITYDGGTIEGDYALLIFINGFRVGGIKLYFLKKYLDDGTISAHFFKYRIDSVFKILWFFITRGFRDSIKNKTVVGNYFKIETKQNIQWNTDGEKTAINSAEIKVIPRAIKFIVHPKKSEKHFIY